MDGQGMSARRRGGRRWLAALWVVLVAALGLALAPATARAATTFVDVDASVAHQEDVIWLADNGISTGFSDGTFKPYSSIARCDMAAFLHRLDGSPDFSESLALSFNDVGSKTPHNTDIWWLSATGITTGWDNGSYNLPSYRPYANVARCDMAAFLYRLAGSPSFDAAKASVTFSDVDSGTPHYREVLWLAQTGVSEGWVNGDGTRSFRPYASIARCDMAAFLHRMYEQGLVANFVDVTLIDASGFLDSVSGGLYTSQKKAAEATYGSGIISGASATYDMVLQSLDFIDELNEIRDAYDVVELDVSGKLMADQAIEADINDVTIVGHSGVSVGASRCLAWGYSDPYGTPDDDTLIYWTGGWMGERKEYEEWVAGGSQGNAPDVSHYRNCVQANPRQAVAGFGTSSSSPYQAYSCALAIGSKMSTTDDTIASTNDFRAKLEKWLSDSGYLVDRTGSGEFVYLM